jgi:hypothetical protein
VGEFDYRADVTYLDDPAFDGMTAAELVGPASEAGHYFIFIADRVAVVTRDNPVLVLDLNDEPGRTFRATVSELPGIEANLSISNMEFHAFADSTEADGVFRGFPPPPRTDERETEVAVRVTIPGSSRLQDFTWRRSMLVGEAADEAASTFGLRSERPEFHDFLTGEIFERHQCSKTQDLTTVRSFPYTAQCGTESGSPA